MQACASVLKNDGLNNISISANLLDVKVILEKSKAVADKKLCTDKLCKSVLLIVAQLI